MLQKNKDDYDRIGEDFSKKRSYLSGDILELKKYAEEGDRILDLGCGNGRLFELFKGMNVNYVGADVSENLLAAAKKKYPAAEFKKVDFLKLPFPDGSFDKIYCLSVFHHIPSRDFRLRFLAEIKRVLKPEGVLILTVWNFWKFWGILEIFKFGFLKIFRRGEIDPVRSSATSSIPQMQKDEVPLETRFLTGRSRLTSQFLLSVKYHKTSNGADFKDIFVPFKDSSGKILAERYFHCFTKRELKRLFSEAGFETVEFHILRRGRYENFCLIGK